MTSTSTVPSAHEIPVPGLRDAMVPTEPERSSPARPRRRRSRFPGPAAHGPAHAPQGSPQVAWIGPGGPLQDLVKDHATAVGAELREAATADAAHCAVVDASVLAERAPTLGGDHRPLLVVTGGGAIPAALWSLALDVGARAVLPLPDRSEELLSRLADLARPRTAAVVIGVAGGTGGAGASSFAARLAAAGRLHGPVTLIDADPLGGGLDLLVEAPAREGIGWAEAAGLGPDDGGALRDGLPRVDEVRLLVAREEPAPAPAALAGTLASLSPLGGIVIADLGAEMVPVAAEHLDHLLLVVPATDHAVRSAARRLRSWRLPAGLAQLVVRRGGPLGVRDVGEDLSLSPAASFRDSPRGTVPLLDVRRGRADRAARTLMASLCEEARS